MAGQRREARPRGRPRLSGNVANEDVKGQGDLGPWGKYRAWPSLAPLTAFTQPERGHLALYCFSTFVDRARWA